MTNSEKSILSELEGEGWTKIDPPGMDAVNNTLIGYYKQEPIKVGFAEEVLAKGSDQETTIYRSGPYRVWKKSRYTTNGTIHQVKVVEAE